MTAADRHGYVIVFPEATRSERCFDVSTSAAFSGVPAGCFAAAGLVLDGGGNVVSGSNLKQWSYNGSTNLQWRLNSTGNGRYQIINRGTGTALDGMGNNSAGSTVAMWYPNSHTNNQWTIGPA